MLQHLGRAPFPQAALSSPPQGEGQPARHWLVQPNAVGWAGNGFGT